MAISSISFSQDVVMADFENVTTPGGDFNFFGQGTNFGGAFNFSGVFDPDKPSESTGLQSLRATWSGTGTSFFNFAILPEVTGWHGTAPLDISSKSHIQMWVKTTSDASGSISLYSGQTPGSEVSEATFQLNGNEWTRVTVAKSDFKKTINAANPVDFTDVQAAQFFVVGNTSTGVQDVWLDDLVATSDVTWGYGWSVGELGWVDTGNWMGWLNTAEDPWIWSISLECWIYFPHGSLSDYGSWFYSLIPSDNVETTSQVRVDISQEDSGSINPFLAGSQNRLDYLQAMGGKTARWCCGGIWDYVWREDGNHNWGFIDNLIGPYISQGVKVVLNISYVPRWMWTDPDDPYLNELAAPEWVEFLNWCKVGHVVPPADYEAWNALLRETVQYLNIEKEYGIIFEVWNEPNSDWFWRGTMEENIEIYEQAARAIREVDENALIGGNCVAGGPLPKNSERYIWVKTFIEYCAENNVPVDFISWHYYELYAQQAHRDASIAYQAELVQELIDENPAIGNPFFALTEWGYSWTASEVLRGPYNGAFVAANLSSALVINGNLNLPNYAFTSFEIFNKLPDQRVQAETDTPNSSVGILASREAGKVSAMIWDFPGGPDGIDIKTHPVEVTFNDLPPGDYTLKRYVYKNNRTDGTSLLEIDSQPVSGGTVIYGFRIKTFEVTLVEIVKN
jgi:hypothetical protein